MTNFNGFSQETLDFFQELTLNNSKAWFDTNRKRYETSVKKPATEFVEEMGEMFHMISPDIQAIPKVNKSLFRINRDTRFSKDKSPYKTNLGMWFWEGERKRMECPGFYFHLEPGALMLAAGMHCMPDFALTSFRNSMNNKLAAESLLNAVNEVSKKGYTVGETHYKRVPKGFDKDHPMREFLLYNGLTVHKHFDIPDELFSLSILDFCFDHFKKMVPIHQWLKEYVK